MALYEWLDNVQKEDPILLFANAQNGLRSDHKTFLEAQRQTKACGSSFLLNSFLMDVRHLEEQSARMLKQKGFRELKMFETTDVDHSAIVRRLKGMEIGWMGPRKLCENNEAENVRIFHRFASTERTESDSEGSCRWG
ncbi:hypothetical protein TNCV_1409691 [Trichonephila clavipes]|uniref:Uncharacterized protein n=1 Tax=Trichonephila clavipes TaxID=2585209 RepID=A0A8X6RBV6_TRICX|nr:hypothetical protein TNCV_1409691 [Trichonephila clavipes]